MDYFSGVTEAIKKASVAFTEALSTVSSVLLNIAGQAPAGADRDRIVENWLRIARMSQDGVVSAIEQGFELWESECRRMMGASKSVSAAQGAANPDGDVGGELEKSDRNLHRRRRMERSSARTGRTGAENPR